MPCNKCKDKTNINLVPSIEELRMRLQNCGSSLRAIDFKYLLDYLQYLTDCCTGNIPNIVEVFVSEKGDYILVEENTEDVYTVIATENNRVK
jgi:hypothetical protein